jgi:hypothetical protein
MKYLLLKVEKRCQTTIEKILKSIVDERRSPNLLAARIYAQHSLSQVLAWQLRAAPDGRDGVKMARACVMLLSLTVALVPPAARLSRHVECGGAAYDYCIQALGCTAEEARRTEAKLGRVRLAARIEGVRIEGVCDWLRSRLDLDDSGLKKMVLTFPQMLGCSVEANLEPTLGWFQTRLDLGDAQLSKLVVRFPILLGLSVEDNLAPTLEWLQARLELDDVQLKKIVVTFPSLLGLSVEDNLAPKLEWLQRRLDLDDLGLRKLVLTFPQLLSYSGEDNMAPKLEWLQTRLDLDDSGLRKMVLAYPALLSYSVEGNMEPKLGFFQEELGLSLSEVRASIVSSPDRLGYSLKTRYRPRLEVCRSVGVDTVVVMLRLTDEKFCKRVGVPLEALRAAQEDV